MRFINFLIEQKVLRENQYDDVIKRDGYVLTTSEEREEDNIKLWHNVKTPDGKEQHLDHSPYEHIDAGTFDKYIAYHKKHGRFPTRKDINSNGPLGRKSLNKLVSTLQEKE